MVYVADSTSLESPNPATVPTSVSSVLVDTAATRRWAERIEKWREGEAVRSSIDTMGEYAWGLLTCPRLMLLPSPDRARSDSLASVCNRR